MARDTRQRLTQLRRARTRASNVARHSIEWMLTEPAKWAMTGEPVQPGYRGLPSWWPFWADVLKENVRDAVRAARTLERTEAADEGREARI